MWKLVIADDEPKIRRGLKKIIDWNSHDIEVAGEAEDGELALELIQKTNPDIVLLDINMPFINGLDMLKQLREINDEIIVIIISGYDDFSYAREALKLQVYDYVLKPVTKENLEEIICSVIEKLNHRKKKKDYDSWVQDQIEQNADKLESNIFLDWFDKRIGDSQLLRELDYMKICFKDKVGILLINISEKRNIEIIDKMGGMDLLKYSFANILNEKFKEEKIKFVLYDNYENIILISAIDSVGLWISNIRSVQDSINNYLKCNVILEERNTTNGILEVKNLYSSILENIKARKKCSSMVSSVVEYINNNYYMNNLSVNEIAEELEISPSYLSKKLKNETGMTFVDYLTNVRIKKAMYIMKDPSVKIYDVAELTGYNDQHYFCRAFKKITGVTPKEYKKGK